MVDIPLEKSKMHSDSKWLIYKPTLKVTKHSLDCIVKVLSVSLIFAEVGLKKTIKVAEKEGRT